MALNFKKALLAGSALVAVSVAHTGAAQAVELQIGSTPTLVGNSIDGNWLRGSGNIDINLDGQAPTMGNAGSDTAIETNGASNIYVFNSALNNQTLTLVQGAPDNPQSAIWTTGPGDMGAPPAHTTTITIGADSHGANDARSVNLSVEGSVRTTSGSTTNITLTGNAANKIFFKASTAETGIVNLGAGTLTLGTGHIATFEAIAAQTFTGNVAGTGTLNFLGTAGTTFTGGTVTATALDFSGNANAKAEFDGATTTITNAITVDFNNVLQIGGATFNANGGLNLSSQNATLRLDGIGGGQTFNGAITGTTANGKVIVSNIHVDGVTLENNVIAKTLELNGTGNKAVFKGAITTFGDEIVVGENDVVEVKGANFNANGGLKLDHASSIVTINGTGPQTFAGNIVGDSGKGTVKIENTSAVININGTVNAKTMTLTDGAVLKVTSTGNSAIQEAINLGTNTTGLQLNGTGTFTATTGISGSGALSLAGGATLAGGSVAANTLASTSGNNTVSNNVTITGATTVSAGAGLTLTGNGGSQLAAVNLGAGSVIAFNHKFGSNVTVTGDVTASGAGSIVKNGAGQLTFSGTAFGAETLEYTGTGHVFMNNLNGSINKVNFGNNSATLTLGNDATSITGDITMTGAVGRIVTGTGDFTFGGAIGSSTVNRLNILTLGGNTTFNKAIFVSAINETHNLTFKANAYTAATLKTTGNVTLEQGTEGVIRLSSGGGDNIVIEGKLTNTSGDNELGSKTVVTGVTEVKAGKLTVMANESALNGGAVVAGVAKLVFEQAGTISVAGTGLTGSGAVEIGAGTVNVTNGTVVTDIKFTADNGSLVLGNNVTALGDGATTGVDFNGKAATVSLGDLDTVAAAFITQENKTGKITTAAAAGTVTFERNIGAPSFRLNEVAINRDAAVFDGQLNVKTLSAAGKNLTFKGATNITDAWSANNVAVEGGRTIAGGDATIGGTLTNNSGANIIASKIDVSGVTTITDGSLDIQHKDSTLRAVNLGANALTFGGFSLGAVTGTGTLVLDRANDTMATSEIGAGGTTLASVTIANGAQVLFGANKLSIASLEFGAGGGGEANLELATGVDAQNIDFRGNFGRVVFGQNVTYSGNAYNTGGNGNGNLDFGAGHTHITGNLGKEGELLNFVNIGGTGEIDNAIYATMMTMDGNVTAKHAIFNTGVTFKGDHKLTLDNATRIIGDVTVWAHGNGTIDFKKGFDGVTGNITGRLKDIRLNKDADVTGNMRAATDTHIKGHKLTVGGDFTADANTTLHFDVADGVPHGQIIAGGAVTIDANTAVKVTVNGGNTLTNGQTITLVDGTGGNGVARLSDGKLEKIGTALLTFTQGASTEDLVIVVQRDGAGNGGTGENNQNTGNALENAWPTTNDPDLKAFETRVLSAKTTEELDALLESVAPDMSGGSVAATVAVGNQTSTIVNNRVNAVRSGDNTGSGIATGNGWTERHMWAQAFGAKADQGKRGGVAGYDADTYGFVVGVDGEVSDHSRLGVALSYANTDVKAQDVNRSSSDVDSYQISLYGDYDLSNDYFLNGQIAYIYSDVDTKRHDVGGVFGNTASGSFHNNQYAARAEIGKAFDAGNNVSLTPSVLANYSYVDVGSYTEKGAGGLSLRNVETDHLQILEFGANLIAEANFDDGHGGVFTPSVHGGYRYDVIGDRVATTASFAGGGAAFGVKGADPAQGTFNVGAGIQWDMSSRVNLSAQYDYQTRSDYDEHSGYIRAGYRF